MSKINIGLILLVINLFLLIYIAFDFKTYKNFLNEQVELLNTKLDDIDDDLHQLNDKD